MPLLDHFRPPLMNRLPWESLHNGILSTLAGRLNAVLPTDFVAIDSLRFGRELEVDVGTVQEEATDGTITPITYTPPPSAGAVSAVLPDSAELRVFNDRDGRKLVAAVELVSPSNKDRSVERQAFAAKCVSYLTAGVSLVVLDVVTTRRAILHNDILSGLDTGSGLELLVGQGLYAVAYRPVAREGQVEVEVWFGDVRLGDPLPTMPLRLTGDLFVPVEFEAAYMEACRKRRLVP